MPCDGYRAGVVSVTGEPGAELEDAFTDLGRGRVGAGVRAPGSGFESIDAVLMVSGEESVELTPGDSVPGRGFGDGEFIRDDLEDCDMGLRHRNDCDVCRDS